jgi:hypothetical protein
LPIRCTIIFGSCSFFLAKNEPIPIAIGTSL